MKYLQYGLIWVYTLLIIVLIGATIQSGRNFINQPQLELMYGWSAGKGCHAVHNLNPGVWRPIADGLVEPGDCLIELEDQAFKPEDFASLLSERMTLPPALRFVEVRVQRGSEAPFTTFIPVIQMSMYRLFQVYGVFIVTAILLIWLGWLAYRSQPHAEQNRIFTLGIWSIALVLLTISHRLPHPFGLITSLVLVNAIPLISAFLFHFAWIFPSDYYFHKHQWIKYVLYPIALYSMWIHSKALINIPTGAAWVLTDTQLSNTINGSMILIAFSTVMMRWGYILWVHKPAVQSKSYRQLRVLFTTWLLGGLSLGVLFFLYEIRGHIWPIRTISGFSFFFMSTIPAAGTTYTMIRYEALAIKKRAYLDGLMLFIISAAIVSIIFLGNTFFYGDGVTFLILLLVSLLTSLFWYTSNPFRQIFETYFLRHQHDTAVINGMITQLDISLEPQETLTHMLKHIATTLEIEWLALEIAPHTLETTDKFRVAETSSFNQRYITPGHEEPKDMVKEVAHKEPIMTRLDLDSQPIQVGWLFIGSRLSTELYDQHDHALFTLIARYISSYIGVYDQIHLLKNVVTRILGSRDKITDDLNHFIHDEVLTKISASIQEIELVGMFNSLDQDSIQKLQHSEKTLRDTSSALRTYIIQEQIALGNISKQFFAAIHSLLGELCQSYRVDLNWIMPHEKAVWEDLPLQTKKTIYRIIHMSIGNAVKHGSPSTITVEFWATTPSPILNVRVTDNGIGFDIIEHKAKTDSTGLMTMLERARMINGTIQISSQPGQGTHVLLAFSTESNVLDSVTPQTITFDTNYDSRPRKTTEQKPHALPMPEEALVLASEPKLESAEVIKQSAGIRRLQWIVVGLVCMGFGWITVFGTALNIAVPQNETSDNEFPPGEIRIVAQLSDQSELLLITTESAALGVHESIPIGAAVTVQYTIYNVDIQPMIVYDLGIKLSAEKLVESNDQTIAFAAVDTIIEPGQTYTVVTSATFSVTGTYKVEPVFYDDYGNERTIGPFPQRTFDVVDYTSSRITHRLTIDADKEWQSSYIYVYPGDQVSIKADGYWTTNTAENKYTSADGRDNETSIWRIAPDAPLGSLLGSINDYIFYIGTEFTETVEYTGTLQFGINDAVCYHCLKENAGEMSVSIKVERP